MDTDMLRRFGPVASPRRGAAFSSIDGAGDDPGVAHNHLLRVLLKPNMSAILTCKRSIPPAIAEQKMRLAV